MTAGRRRSALLLAIALATACSFLAASVDRRSAAIPWGAMYTPNEHLTTKGMTGAIKHYRGERGAAALVADLAFASERGVRLILSLGSVSSDTYLDEAGHLRMETVHRELQPFFAASEQIAPFIEDGTVWGVRFLDEPHDPAGLPPDFEVDPDELSDVFALIRAAFGDVPIGSTAPPSYMARVPGAGFASGQVVHGRLPAGFSDPIDVHRHQSALAHDHGLLYVASLNANTNPIDSETFRRMCAIDTVDFATSWQWPQGHHPMPSFEARFFDPEPAAQEAISAIPAACRRGEPDAGG